MKSAIFVILLLFIYVNLFGQNDLNEKRLIDFKLYSNFDFSSKYINYETDTINGTSKNEYVKEINGFNFSPSLVFYSKKGNSSEIEISRLDYSNKYNEKYTILDSTGAILNVMSGNTHKQFELYLRYEYRLKLFKKKDWKKTKLILGFSGTPFVVWDKTEPVLNTEFTKHKTIVGFYLSVIPRIEYSISERWYLDLNIPVAIFTSHYTSFRNEDPSLPSEERSKNIFDFYNGPISYAIRLGIGFKI